VPFGEVWQEGEGGEGGAAENARDDAGGERPDGLDERKILFLGDGEHEVRVRHGFAVGEQVQFAGDEEFGALRELREAGGVEQDDFGEPCGIADDDAGGVGFFFGQFVADDVDAQRGDGAGLGGGDGGDVPAVEEVDG